MCTMMQIAQNDDIYYARVCYILNKNTELGFSILKITSGKESREQECPIPPQP